jgi:hypothetical protein
MATKARSWRMDRLIGEGGRIIDGARLWIHRILQFY